MVYRLSDKFGEADLVQWAERQNGYGEELGHWFGGIGIGAFCTLVVLWVLGVF